MPNPGPLILFSRENLDITYISYKVADSLETAEFLSDVWREFCEGKATINDVLTAYEENGFEVNQDLPGNMLWEDLYSASPKGTKVNRC